MSFRVQSFLLVMPLFCSLSIHASAPKIKEMYTIRWVMAHKPEVFFVETGKHFKKLVEDASAGQIQVEIVTHPLKVADSARVPYLRKEALQKIQDRDYEMSQIYTYALETYLPELAVLDLPYVFDSDKHVTSVLEGDIGQGFLKELNATSPFHTLGFTYSGGFLAIPSLNKKIIKAGDFKGLKYAPWPGSIGQEVTKALGAKPVRFNFSSANDDKKIKFLSEMLLDGDVDIGDLSCGDVYEYLEKNKEIKVINKVGHRVVLTALVMNKEFYNQLPTSLQKIVDDSAFKAARFERDMIAKRCDELQYGALNGAEIVEFKDRSGFNKIIRPILEKTLNNPKRKSLFDKIRSKTDSK